MHTHGVIENLSITVNGDITMANFYVVDIEDTGKNHLVILGRPWLWQSDVVSYLFGVCSKYSKLSLKIKFFGLELKPGAHLDVHINKMISLMNKLASIHSPTEDDAMVVLLKSMPEEYDNLVTTLKYFPDPTFEGFNVYIVGRRKEEGKQ